MALPVPTVLPVPISGGLSQKSDDLQQLPPKTLIADNVTFQTVGAVRKRNGFTSLTKAIGTAQSVTQITNGAALMAYGNELLTADGTELYSYDASGACWIDKGPLASVHVTQRPVIRNTYTQTAQDGNTHSSGMQVYAWEDTQGGSRYSVIDGTTGNPIVTSVLIDANAIKPKVLVVGQQFIILWYQTDSGLLKGALIGVANPTATLMPVAITTSAADSTSISTFGPNYDAAIVQTIAGSWLYIAWNNAAGGVTVNGTPGTNPLQVIGSGGTQNNQTSITTVGRFISVFGDLFAQATVVLVYDNADAKMYAFDDQLDDPPISTQTLVSNATHLISIVGISTSASAVSFTIFFTVDTSGTGVTWRYAIAQPITVTGVSYTVAGGTSPYIYGVNLAAKPLLFMGQAFPIVAYQSTFQNTYFLLNSALQPIAKILYGLGGGFPIEALIEPAFALGTTYSANNLVTNASSVWKLTTATGHPSITPAAFVVNTTYQTVTPGSTFGVVISRLGGYVTAASGTWGTLTGLTLIINGSTLSLTGITTAAGLKALIDGAVIAGITTTVVGTTVTIVSSGNYAISGTGIFSTPGLNLATNGVAFGVYKLTTVPAAAALIAPTGTGTMTDGNGNVWTYEGALPILTADSTYVVGTTKSMDGGANVWTYEGAAPTAMLPETAALSDTAYRTPFLFADREPTTASAIQKQLTTQQTNTGVMAVTMDFGDESDSFLRAEAGGNLQVGGGYVWTYDGVTAVELGFHLFPEFVSDSLAMSGNVVGVLTYAVTYEWTDNNGQIERSALYTFQATINSASIVTITVPNPTMTLKQSPRSPPNIVIYRTTNAGTILYFVASAPSTFAAGSASVSITDNFADTSILGNALCYTQPLDSLAVPVVQNIPPDAVSALAVYQNRLVALSSVDPYTLWYSKQIVQGQPVEFGSELTWSIDPTGGPATAIASNDTQLYVFKQTRVYQLTGQGPSDNATSNDFNMTLVTTECGCINPRSISITPQGIMFQSTKGIWRMGRDGVALYVGADVENYNAQTITSGQLVTNTNQVRYTLAAQPNPPADPLGSPTGLTFDTFVNQWSTATPINAVDATIWSGATWPSNSIINGTDVSGQAMGPTYCYLTPSGAVMLETPGLFFDNGSWITQTIGTAYLQLGRIGGFQRVWRYVLTGTLKSNHRVQIQFSYDFGPSSQTATFSTQTINVYGSGPYGAGVYGGSTQQYQWDLIPAQQKGTAQQLTLSDMPPPNGVPSGSGEGAIWSSLTAKIGVEPGTSRLPTSNKTG